MSERVKIQIEWEGAWRVTFHARRFLLYYWDIAEGMSHLSKALLWAMPDRLTFADAGEAELFQEYMSRKSISLDRLNYIRRRHSRIIERRITVHLRTNDRGMLA
jgi:hypothetical protein